MSSELIRCRKVLTASQNKALTGFRASIQAVRLGLAVEKRLPLTIPERAGLRFRVAFACSRISWQRY